MEISPISDDSSYQRHNRLIFDSMSILLLIYNMYNNIYSIYLL